MAESKEQPIRREHDSMDDFEHLEHVQDGQSSSHLEPYREEVRDNMEENFDMDKDMINFSLNQSAIDSEDSKKATLLLLDAEKGKPVEGNNFEVRMKESKPDLLTGNIEDQSEVMSVQPPSRKEEILEKKEEAVKEPEIISSVEKKTDDSWSVPEKPQPVLQEPQHLVFQKPQPVSEKPQPAPREETKIESVSEYLVSDTEKKERTSAPETGESEFESEPEASPVKSLKPVKQEARREKVEDVEIAPKEIFRSMGIDAWFNPERLNPKVAALIYWRDPKKSGAAFGCILGVLLSLAYFSLISVLAYLSLLVLTGTIAFRIYKTVLQAVQKTSDGHPFKDILELDLTVPAEKVHEVADVAVAHANAAVSELRRLFLVEDFVDSLKFGVLLWCLTYVGSWFNGMTLIIIGVVALFTLPKIYETNKAQIDQNLALVHGKINELTTKVKAAIPLGKKEAAKEE
ncbi:reticulon-3 isoform X1 [Hylaeus anthracinus]|uniref:reticulon-3 isoform X1 n=1 Tax=Hylaeus anthracinus TaxID=313031 RepID=UPI0023B8975B|nr:reticulon-3 isoform X1 [Hylaeus anthracinus]